MASRLRQELRRVATFPVGLMTPLSFLKGTTSTSRRSMTSAQGAQLDIPLDLSRGGISFATQIERNSIQMCPTPSLSSS